MRVYKFIDNEQAAKLANALGPEFTAAAKNDLINFADAFYGLDRAPKAEKPSKEAIAAAEARDKEAADVAKAEKAIADRAAKDAILLQAEPELNVITKSDADLQASAKPKAK